MGLEIIGFALRNHTLPKIIQEGQENTIQGLPHLLPLTYFLVRHAGKIPFTALAEKFCELWSS